MPSSRALKQVMRRENPAPKPGSDKEDWANAGIGTPKGKHETAKVKAPKKGY